MENKTKNTLRLRFLGAIGTVTGSCTLLEYYCYDKDQKQYFLIDAGSFQNESTEQNGERNKILKHFAKEIKKIFITHAHLDHIGLLPEIIKYGFRGEVCCTQATHDLIMTMLTHGEDSKSNLELLKKISFKDIDGKYCDKPNCGFGKTYISLADGFLYGYLRSSHVLGSCTFYFQWTEKNYPQDVKLKEREWKYLYFSGDIGPVTDKVTANIMFKRHHMPLLDKKDKYIVMESTYGDKIRNKENLFERKINKLKEIIDAANSRGGVVIIPSFALDRAQQILVDLFYIFKNKETNISLLTDDTWKGIIKARYNDVKCEDISAKIDALEGKDKKSLRKRIKNEIEQVVKQHRYTVEKPFSKINDECQNAIAEIFEQNNIQKPSLNSTVQNKLNFSFDSPLIEKINKVYLDRITDEYFSTKDNNRKFKYLSDRFLEEFNITGDEIIKQKNKIKEILSCFLCKSLKTNNIKIFVTASGMCEEGRVIDLLEKYLPDEKATIILTGYQAVNTNGFLLKNLSKGKYDENNKKEKMPLPLRNNELWLADIKCIIEDMSDYYSGHADQEQLLDYIIRDGRDTENIAVLLNHGTDTARETLKSKIEEHNNKIKVVLPEFNKWFNVVTLEYEPEDIEFKTEDQFSFVQVSGIHIYYPVSFDNEKLQTIIDYIVKIVDT
ncbi:MAG: MBL fold metallo-hydrolase [Treponema sp.]|jgi:Cft2 family RNA processing exonuclease|nr:MBL fold metallo-hydrolase [Treponema sp.]